MPKELTPALAKQIAEEEGFEFDRGLITHNGEYEVWSDEHDIVLIINIESEKSKIKTPASFRTLLQTAKGE